MTASILDGLIEITRDHSAVSIILTGHESSPRIFICIEQLLDENTRSIHVYPMDRKDQLHSMKQNFSLKDG